MPYTKKYSKMKQLTTISFLLAGILLSSCGSSTEDSTKVADSLNMARADNTTSADQAAVPAEEDSKFAVQAASGGLAEVQLGQLAQEKGTTAAVKDFGRMMVEDHSKANEELKTLAASKNISLPSAPGEEKQKTFADLSAKTGKDFDKAYISEMVRDHEKDVKLFEDAQQTVKDPELRQFVEKTLPVLRKHLEHIQGMEKTAK